MRFFSQTTEYLSQKIKRLGVLKITILDYYTPSLAQYDDLCKSQTCHDVHGGMAIELAKGVRKNYHKILYERSKSKQICYHAFDIL